MARVGRISTTVNNVTTTIPVGAFSTDGGTTWARFATTPAAASSSAGSSIAVSADGATLIWDTPANTRATPPAAGGPQFSRDHGATWTASAGIGAIRPVFADRVNPSKFYGYDGAMGRLYVSTDGGATFALAAPVSTALRGTGRPRATPGIEGDVWLVTTAGLSHSVDSGVTFAPVPAATATVALGQGKAAPGKTYPALYLIGTANQAAGIYRSDDTGATWTRIDDAQHLWATAVTLTGDPRLYGRVYVGTNGRGILYGDMAP